MEHTVLCSLPFPASSRHFSLVFFSLSSQDFETIRKGFFEQVASFVVRPVFMDDIKQPVYNSREPECLQKGRMKFFLFLDSLRKSGSLAPVLFCISSNSPQSCYCFFGTFWWNLEDTKLLCSSKDKEDVK